MTTKQLHIGHGSDGAAFYLPMELITSTQAIIAKKRVGKSYTASVEAEEMLSRFQQIAVIDPTSAWYGLRSSADGSGPGYEVAVFGGEHADAPLDPRSGKAMARALVEHGFSAIFDIGDWITDDQIAFVYAFSSELLRINKAAVHLFIDEADTFAPQLLESKEQKKCLGAVSRLVKQGGIKGVGVTMISQRSADLNKKILSQIERLTLLGMRHPPDIKPVSEWVSVNVGPAYAETVSKELPRLEVGEAFICDGPNAGGSRIRIRKRTTFNSGATPKPGERKMEPKVLAKIDIERLGKEISDSVERAKADDPEVLRAKIAELERKLRDVPAPTVETKTIEVPGKPDPEELKRIIRKEIELRGLQVFNAIGSDVVKILFDAGRRLNELGELMDKQADALSHSDAWCNALTFGTFSFETDQAIQTIKPMQIPRAPEAPRAAPARSGWQATHSPAPQAKQRASVSNGSLTNPQKRILEALQKGLAINRDSLTRTWVGFLSGASPKSSSFINNLSALRSKGLIDYREGSRVCLTPVGMQSTGHVPQRMSEFDLHNQILSMITQPQRNIMNQLLDMRGNVLTRERLAEGAGASFTSSSFINNLSALRSLGLLDYGPNSTVFAKGDLFL